MKLQVKKLDPEAKVPVRAHADDAGLDLFALEDAAWKPFEIKGVRTGIAMVIPSGYVGLIWDKSGVGMKTPLRTKGGVVDASYRGEILVLIVNISEQEFRIEKGSKIAQMLIQKVELPEVVEVNDLDETDRGQGGFGSTGV